MNICSRIIYDAWNGRFIRQISREVKYGNVTVFKCDLVPRILGRASCARYMPVISWNFCDPTLLRAMDSTSLLMTGNRKIKLATITSFDGNQKSRKILMEGRENDGRWQEHQDRGANRRPVKYSSSTPNIVSNYSIVASCGELARNSITACERAPASVDVVNNKIRRNANQQNGLNGCTRDEKSYQNSNAKKVTTPCLRRGDKDSNAGNRTKRIIASSSARASIPKSASVPANLKEEGLPIGKATRGSILKKSSTFLANLTHGTNNPGKKRILRLREDKSPRGVALGDDFYRRVKTKKYSSSILTNNYAQHFPFEKSTSLQTLLSDRITRRKSKSSAAVKKSVSFSSDTSFEAKRAPFRVNTAVHEAKVYDKGVLRDRNPIVEFLRKVSPNCGTASPSGGPKALLKAARDADDTALREIVGQLKNLGLNKMDVNAADHSGRTAISYMAGNGAIAMLEAALSLEGVDANIPDNEGNTPLHFAAQAGQTECLNILLEKCPYIEVDARNILGFTPLMKAALQGRTKCAKILLFAGANPTLRDHGRGLRAEQWARFCGRYVCAEVIERFAKHRLLERTTACRWGSEPELAARVFQGKVTPVPVVAPPPAATGLRSKIRRVFRSTSGPDQNFSLVSQLTSAALCVSSPALPKPGEIPPVVKSLLRPLNIPQLRITLVSPPQEMAEKCQNFGEKIENTIPKPPRTKKKNK